MKRTPLKRSTRPIRRIGKKGKARAQAMKAASAYLKQRASGFINCQMCRWSMDPGREDLHHKVLRSQGGKDTPENLVALCRGCHSEVHLDFSKLERIRASGANIENGQLI